MYLKMTLLDIVQDILASMDSDEVSDIFDTDESTQVVSIIHQTYNDIISTVDFPDMWDLFELEPSIDQDLPTVMYLPEDVSKLEWVRYNHSGDLETDRNWRPVFPLERKRFFNRMNAMDSDDSRVKTSEYKVDAGTFDIRVWNDRNPAYFTTTDNRTLIFDSYDAEVGQTLQGNRTQCYGMKIPLFKKENTFTPQFEPRQFTLFFNEAKSQCFSELKQVTNAKAEQRARRGWVHSQRKKNNTKASPIKEWKPNYGRRR